MNRVILHLDLDAFFCAVEELRDPSLKGLPFAVGGDADRRGVVASCSYPARAYGVRSAMPMITALKKCPDLIIVGKHFDLYTVASRKVMAILHELTPLVEQLSIDEAFLDVTGITGTGEQIARKLQEKIYHETQLPASLGVATNKLVAKIANNIGKSQSHKGNYPNAIKVIPTGHEAAFLAPLPIRELWGVGPKTAETLYGLGIQTIGHIAAHPEKDLRHRFGKLGADISRRAKGIDTRPVETERDTKSVSKEITFDTDINDPLELKRTLRKLSDGVGYQLRKSGLRGNTIKLKLRWSDFTTLTRQITHDSAIDQDDIIYKEAVALFEKNWIYDRPVRLIGVGVSGFDRKARQLSLWDAPVQEENRQLQSALDEIRHRFGESAISRASDIDED